MICLLFLSLSVSLLFLFPLLLRACHHPLPPLVFFFPLLVVLVVVDLIDCLFVVSVFACNPVSSDCAPLCTHARAFLPFWLEASLDKGSLSMLCICAVLSTLFCYCLCFFCRSLPSQICFFLFVCLLSLPLSLSLCFLFFSSTSSCDEMHPPPFHTILSFSLSPLFFLVVLKK